MPRGERSGGAEIERKQGLRMSPYRRNILVAPPS